jgi:hypothetical protein
MLTGSRSVCVRLVTIKASFMAKAAMLTHQAVPNIVPRAILSHLRWIIVFCFPRFYADAWKKVLAQRFDN